MIRTRILILKIFVLVSVSSGLALQTGCNGGGGGDMVVDVPCTDINGMNIVSTSKAYKCCEVESGLNPSCYDAEGNFKSKVESCKNWFDKSSKVTKLDSTGQPPKGCPQRPTNNIDFEVLEPAAEAIQAALSNLRAADHSIAKAGGAEQDNESKTDAATAVFRGEQLDEVDFPNIDDLELPKADLSTRLAPSDFGSEEGSGSGLSAKGLADSSNKKGPQQITEQGPDSESQVRTSAMSSQYGSSAGAVKKRPTPELANVFGGQSSIPSRNPNSEQAGEELSFTQSARSISHVSKDDPNYFQLISKHADLFRVVELRYRRKALKWRE